MLANIQSVKSVLVQCNLRLLTKLVKLTTPTATLSIPESNPMFLRAPLVSGFLGLVAAFVVFFGFLES